MNLATDEGVGRVAVERLRAGGDDTVYVAALSPAAEAEAVAKVLRVRAAVLVGRSHAVAPGTVRIRRLPCRPAGT